MGLSVNTLRAVEVAVTNNIALQKTKEYVNIRQWVKECKKRWGMKKAEAKIKWQDLLADDKVPKTRDQMNWVTMPALQVFASGPQLT